MRSERAIISQDWQRQRQAPEAKRLVRRRALLTCLRALDLDPAI
jgi:hypothetical protein